jgi:hypothetical protein
MPNQEPTPERIKEFDLALESFHNSHNRDVLDLGYQTLLEKENSLRGHFELSVFNDCYNFNYDRINRLFESDETLFNIKDLNGDNILQIIIKDCKKDGISFIEKYIDKFEMKDELKNKLISDYLFYNPDHQDFCTEDCIKIIKILVNSGVKITNEDLKKCWQEEVFKNLVEHAEPSTLKSGLFLIFENNTNENEILKIKYLLEEKGVRINDFLEWSPETSQAKNNFVDFVLNHGDETTKTSFLAQLSSSGSEQKVEFFKDLSKKNLNKLDIVKLIYEKNSFLLKKIINSHIDILLEPVILTQIIEKYPEFLEEKDEDNLTLIDRAIDGKLDALKTIIEAKPEFLEKQNRHNETPLLNLLRKYVHEPYRQNHEKIKYIFKKQFKRDLKYEEIQDFVEFTKTYNFLNLFYDKYGQAMYDKSFKSTLLSSLPKEEDLQDDLSKQLLKIYQQIAKKKVPEIKCKDDTGKQTHLYSYSAEVKGHASYFIFHVNEEKKLTKISYCDGHQIFPQRQTDRPGYINGTTTFLLKEPQDFNNEFAKEFIRKNSEGKKVLDLKKEFCEKLKEGKIFDFEFSTMTHSIPTKNQIRSNCTLKSFNIDARFLLEQQNQYKLFTLDPKSKPEFGEGYKPYKDLRQKMVDKMCKKLGKYIGGLPADFIDNIKFFNKINKWKNDKYFSSIFYPIPATEEQIAQFNNSLENFKTSKGSNLSYLDLLEKNPSLEVHFRKLIKKEICDFRYDLIGLLVSKDQMPEIDGKSTLRSLIEFYGGSQFNDIIKKLIAESDSIENDKDKENNNLIASLLVEENNQDEDLPIFVNPIIKSLIEKGVSVDDKNNSGETPLDLCINLEILKTLAEFASPETLEKKLCHILLESDLEDNVDSLKFLLTEKKVKIWNFKDLVANNNFIELVCQDNEIKDSFLEQLSSSSSEQRDKFFEGFSEKFQEQLTKQQELQLIVEELGEYERKDDKYGFKQCYSDPLFFSPEIMNKNAEFLREVINGSDDKKDSFMEAHYSASPDKRMAFLSGLKPECINFILEKAEKNLDSLKNQNEILEKFKHLINRGEEIPSSSDGPKVGSKRTLEESQGIEVTSCYTVLRPHRGELQFGKG